MADLLVYVGLQPSEYRNITIGTLAAIKEAHARKVRESRR